MSLNKKALSTFGYLVLSLTSLPKSLPKYVQNNVVKTKIQNVKEKIEFVTNPVKENYENKLDKIFKNYQINYPYGVYSLFLSNNYKSSIEIKDEANKNIRDNIASLEKKSAFEDFLNKEFSKGISEKNNKLRGNFHFPKTEELYQNHPDALDVFGNIGEEIPAVSDGIVLIAKNNFSQKGGNIVLTFNPKNKKYYYYAHLKEIFVSTGDVISGGRSLIGSLGESGSAKNTEPHLHIAIHKSLKNDNKPLSSKQLMKILKPD